MLPEIDVLWSAGHNVWLERKLWLRVLIHQHDLGLEVLTTDDLVGAAAAVVFSAQESEYCLERIRERELVTRHDVKARLEVACEDAGHEHLHLGMTSADVVENTMAIRVRDSVEAIGRRAGVEFTDVLRRYRFRGIRGPMGTAQDQVDLLGAEGARELDRRLADDFGFGDLLDATGQVAHRSAEFDVITSVYGRLAHRLGRGEQALMRGYIQMLAEISGNTWNEGDVSQSVVRRVAIPNALRLLWYST